MVTTGAMTIKITTIKTRRIGIYDAACLIFYYSRFLRISVIFIFLKYFTSIRRVIRYVPSPITTMMRY